MLTELQVQQFCVSSCAQWALKLNAAFPLEQTVTDFQLKQLTIFTKKTEP